MFLRLCTCCGRNHHSHECCGLSADKEIESLRARISEIEQGDVLVEAGLLMVDVPEPGTDMAKVMRVNQIMRRKHDDDIKRIAELEQELSDEREEVELKTACINGMSANTNRIAAERDAAIARVERLERCAEHYEAVMRRAVEITLLKQGRCMCTECTPGSFIDTIIARAKAAD